MTSAERTKRLLVIDALNMYFRAYIVDPSLSTNGQPIGGLKGFLKILQKLVREMKPDEVVICWDGAGGSRRRKTKNKNYKQGRSPIRLNRDIRTMSEAEEQENKMWQQQRLIEYLNNMPIIQLMLEAVEADDIISYVVQDSKYRGWQKIIVSSDKDFFQLCDEETIIYRPIQKKFVNRKSILEEYKIHPTNFALARAMVGDRSDNLEGIRGVGLASVAKRFEFLSEDKAFLVEDIVKRCEETDSKLKIYNNVMENRNLIEDNYRLMQLYAPSISPQGKTRMRYALDNFVPEFNQTGTKTMMIKDGFGVWDCTDLFAFFKRVVSNKSS
jgi:DNA polymerase I